LELQHRLIRQTINIAVSKAMEDMKSNTRRSIRNLIDLGLLFSTSENQKCFFDAAKKVITNPKNPYNSLVKRIISDVNNDTIKKVGLNLGYSSLIYGANKLKKRQDYFGGSLPWLLIFDVYESGSDFFHQMEHFIREGRDMGIYSYIFCFHEASNIIALCEIAKRFDECLFVFKVFPDLITDQTAEALSKLHNTMVSVQATDASLTDESCLKAFHILKNNRCFYGFHTNYDESTFSEATSTEYVRRAISYGNIFGVYIAEKGVSASCRNAVHDFVCSIRGGAGLPLVTLEWSRDMEEISRKIGVPEGYRTIRPEGQSYDRHKKERAEPAAPLPKSSK